MKDLQHKKIRNHLLIFLSVLGPGIITANVDSDASGIYTYSLAGARFGYYLLWAPFPITVALVVVQEMVARMRIIIGKELADLIGSYCNTRAFNVIAWITCVVMILLTVPLVARSFSPKYFSA